MYSRGIILLWPSKKMGFRVAGEEYQPVNEMPVLYDKMEWTV